MKKHTLVELLVLALALSLSTVSTAVYADFTRIEESHPAIVRSAGWFAVSDGSVSGGRVGVSKTVGATATIYFTGTGIKWIGYRCTCAAGYANVLLDGNLQQPMVQTWNDTGQQAQAEIYSVSGLAAGNHSLKIEVIGEGSYTPYVVVDAFDIENGNVLSSAPPRDTTPPTARLTSPLYPDNIVTGMVTLTAEAADNIGVVRVEFFAGQTLIGSDVTAPYAITRDTSSIPSGSTYSIHVVAYDTDGNRSLATTAAPQVIVNHADQTRPMAAITSPAAGSSMSGTIDVAGAASDAAGISQVTFKVDALMSPKTDTDSPYVVSYDTTGWLDGKHTLTAEATDGNGNTGTSQAVTLTVNNSVQPGMVRIHDDDPRISYSGSWVIDSTASFVSGDTFHWGSAHQSSAPGSTASITFTGTGIRWIGLGCEHCAPATVSIDGGTAQQVWPWGPFSVGYPGIKAHAVYTSPVLPYGTHTLVITVQPQVDRPDTGPFVFVDGFEILN